MDKANVKEAVPYVIPRARQYSFQENGRAQPKFLQLASRYRQMLNAIEPQVSGCTR
jgi:hypothetical protein